MGDNGIVSDDVAGAGEHVGHRAIERRSDGHFLELPLLHFEGVLKGVNRLPVSELLPFVLLPDLFHQSSLLDEFSLGIIARFRQALIVLQVLPGGRQIEGDLGADGDALFGRLIFARDMFDLQLQVAGVDLGQEGARLHRFARVELAADKPAAHLTLQVHLIFGLDGHAAGLGVGRHAALNERDLRHGAGQKEDRENEERRNDRARQ